MHTSLTRNKLFFLSFCIILYLPIGVHAQGSENPLIECAWRKNSITLDGKIYPVQTEWSEITPTELEIGVRYGLDPPYYKMRVWAINDEENLYLLYRIEFPENEIDDGDWVWISYFSGTFNSETGAWDHSDGIRLTRDSAVDWCCYNESRRPITLEDTQASPPGVNDVEGAMTYDGTYYWCEMKKPLNSGDQQDWEFELGKTYPKDEGVIIIGFYSHYHLVGTSIRIDLLVSDRPTSSNGNATPPPQTFDINWSLETIAAMAGICGATAGVIGWLARDWRGRKRRNLMFREYMEEIDNIYTRFKMNSRQCEAELYKIKDKMKSELRESALDPNKYKILNDRVDDYLKEIREEIMGKSNKE